MGEIQPVSQRAFARLIYFFLAAGLAFADLAGFLASTFLAATSFFAAISVAPLEKNVGHRCPELSSSLVPESRGDSKVRHSHPRSELFKLSYRSNHAGDPRRLQKMRQAENLTQQRIVESDCSATLAIRRVSRRRNWSRHLSS